MDFHITHDFAADRDAVARALLDRNFQESLRDLGALAERQVLSQEELEGGGVRRRTRCVLDVQLSGTAKRFLGDAEPSWVEEAVWDPARYTWRWHVIPEVAADLFKAAGTISLTDGNTTTRREVAGSVRVSVPLYGGKVERWVVEGLQRAYAEEAERLDTWLSREA